MIQIGLRGSRFSPDDIKWGEDRGFTCVTFDDFEAMGRDKLVKQIDRVTGNGPTYITIDIDGLDPAWAIGTGVPEIGGLTRAIARSSSGRCAASIWSVATSARLRPARSFGDYLGDGRQSHVGDALRHRREQVESLARRDANPGGIPGTLPSARFTFSM